MKHILLLSILFIIFSCNHQKGGEDTYPNGKFSADTSGESLYTTDADDRGMNNAMEAARQNLVLFDRALKSADSNFYGFAIKKRFAVGDSGEHIWLNHVRFYKDGYKAVINNEPIIANNIKLGDTVFVTKNQISDWMYIDKNILRGGYTMRVELKRMSARVKAEFLKGLDYKIEE